MPLHPSTTPHYQHIDALYEAVRELPARDPAWAEFRAEQAKAMPDCVNHPERPAYGKLGEASDWLCADCVAAALPTWRTMLRSSMLVSGGYPLEETQ
jgi:hypothetical protein